MKTDRNRLYKWLLIFYTVPSRPVKNRMRLWRQLANFGAIQLKGAVYILPYTDEHQEFFQWIISEVVSMDGGGSFVKVENVETMTDEEIISLFTAQREQECKKLDKALDEFERKLNNVRKGAKALPGDLLHEKLAKHKRDFDAMKKRDFFAAAVVISAGRRIDALEADLRHTLGLTEKTETAAGVHEIAPQRREDFQGKTWVTRKQPFVDRMASAWLIKKFVDVKAVFEFADEKDLSKIGKNRVAFDVRGGDFTHTGDLCTFEVLLKAFGLKDKALRKIAEIVHQLDLKDDRYLAPEAKGVEEILLGLRKTAENDVDALAKGISVFEMLYASQK
ncbi:MAG: chromate resistance protein ChrB domain-containing protein [Chloroflexota bacterium]